MTLEYLYVTKCCQGENKNNPLRVDFLFIKQKTWMCVYDLVNILVNHAIGRYTMSNFSPSSVPSLMTSTCKEHRMQLYKLNFTIRHDWKQYYKQSSHFITNALRANTVPSEQK